MGILIRVLFTLSVALLGAGCDVLLCGTSCSIRAERCTDDCPSECSEGFPECAAECAASCEAERRTCEYVCNPKSSELD